MEEKKIDRSKKIIAIQMFSIGVVLFIFGIVVTVFSPFKTMDPVIRKWAIVSDGSIILAGLLFMIAGRIRKVMAEKEESEAA